MRTLPAENGVMCAKSGARSSGNGVGRAKQTLGRTEFSLGAVFGKPSISCASRMITDVAAFIRANTRVLSPPHVPELRLHLADDAVALWRMTEAELCRTGLEPPFWAFAWPGGQALARHILDRP